MSKFSNYQLVHDLIKAFKQLAPGQGEDVITEIEDFCKGYREGKAEVWDEMLSLDVEKVIGDVSGKTLAATMTAMKIKPGHLNRGRA